MQVIQIKSLKMLCLRSGTKIIQIFKFVILFKRRFMLSYIVGSVETDMLYKKYIKCIKSEKTTTIQTFYSVLWFK